MDLQDEKLEMFWVDQKNRSNNFRWWSQRTCQIVDLLRKLERQKHVLEHARKQKHKNFSHYFRIILKSLDRARALICFSEVILP